MRLQPVMVLASAFLRKSFSRKVSGQVAVLLLVTGHRRHAQSGKQPSTTYKLAIARGAALHAQ